MSFLAVATSIAVPGHHESLLLTLSSSSVLSQALMLEHLDFEPNLSRFGPANCDGCCHAGVGKEGKGMETP